MTSRFSLFNAVLRGMCWSPMPLLHPCNHTVHIEEIIENTMSMPIRSISWPGYLCRHSVYSENVPLFTSTKPCIVKMPKIYVKNNVNINVKYFTKPNSWAVTLFTLKTSHCLHWKRHGVYIETTVLFTSTDGCVWHNDWQLSYAKFVGLCWWDHVVQFAECRC